MPKTPTSYERLVILALLQVASIQIFERAASWLGRFILLFSSTGTGPVINALFWLCTWGLVVLAIVLPIAWFFRDAQASSAYGLIVGSASALMAFVVNPSEPWLPILILLIYAIYGGVRGVTAYAV